jgi:L-lactate utilization protein LutC
MVRTGKGLWNMNARNTILSGIRRSLTGVVPTVGDAHPGAPATPEDDARTLAALFSQELVRVEGEVAEARDHAESIAIIGRTLSSASPRTTMVSGEQLFRDHLYTEQLRKHLPASQGVEECSESNLSLISSMETGIVSASGLIAETGTVLLLPSQRQPRRLALLPEMVIVVARVSQLTLNMETILARLRERGAFSERSSFVLMTGPSRTSDIEKVSVKGVHGPRRFMVVLVHE